MRRFKGFLERVTTVNRAHFYAALAHNSHALLAYDAAWLVLLVLAVPFALRLRRAARQMDRKIRWEAETQGRERGVPR